VAFEHLAVHVRLEEAHRGAPFRLGSIQGHIRHIRLAQRFGRRSRIVRHECDPDCYADLVLQGTGGDRTLQCLNHAQRHIGGGFRAHEVACQYRKLIATEAGEKVAVPEGAEQSLRDNDQDLIADRMTMNIVDFLETVQVQQLPNRTRSMRNSGPYAAPPRP
jgi:hypothetical protein